MTENRDNFDEIVQVGLLYVFLLTYKLRKTPVHFVIIVMIVYIQDRSKLPLESELMLLTYPFKMS